MTEADWNDRVALSRADSTWLAWRMMACGTFLGLWATFVVAALENVAEVEVTPLLAQEPISEHGRTWTIDEFIGLDDGAGNVRAALTLNGVVLECRPPTPEPPWYQPPGSLTLDAYGRAIPGSWRWVSRAFPSREGAQWSSFDVWEADGGVGVEVRGRDGRTAWAVSP